MSMTLHPEGWGCTCNSSPCVYIIKIEVIAPQRYSFLFFPLAFIWEVRCLCCFQEEQTVEPVGLDLTPLVGVCMVALRC